MKSLFKAVLGSAGVAALFFLVGCAHLQPGGEAKQSAAGITVALDAESLPAGQLLLVLGEGKGSSLAKLYFLERGSAGWQLHRGPLTAMLGRNGFAAPGAKREGDGATPAGLFPLEFVFGYAPSIASAMPYRQASDIDIWVDDPNSPDYNGWVKKGTTASSSFEEMKLPDQRYRHGIVIGYNRNPVIKGMGSAIFVHVWPEEGKSTAGCVSLDETELVRIIARLDPAKKPMILMENREDLAAMPGLSPLAILAAASPPVSNPPAANPAASRDANLYASNNSAADPAANLPAANPPAVNLPAVNLPAVNLPDANRSVASDELERLVRSELSGAPERLVEYRGRDGFFGMAVPVPKVVEREMRLKKSWREGCPVPIDKLSYLVLGYWGFDGKPQVGELVLHRKLALSTVRAFGELYAMRFPIERMELIERYDADDDRSMAANNTSAFNCRDVAGKPGVFSNHSFGTAIDINPVQNPYLVPKSAVLKGLGWNGVEEKGLFLEKIGYPKVGTVASFCGRAIDNCLVLPPNGVPFMDRSKPAAGLLVVGPVVQAFTGRGFEWGGLWRNTADYQHFQVLPAKLQ